jgi:hypothetical protein
LPAALTRIIRTLPLVGLCVLLLVTRAEARHRGAFVDLDADGRRDRVTLDVRHPWIVRVWLSATRSTHFIRSTQPLRAIAVVDLNGDRHLELIASGRSRGLQVWTKAPSGFVKYRRRARPPTPRDVGGAGRHRVDDDSGGLPPGIAAAKVTLAAVITSLDRRAVTPDGGRSGASQPGSRRSTFDLTPLSPRPPPALI